MLTTITFVADGARNEGALVLARCDVELPLCSVAVHPIGVELGPILLEQKP